MHAECNGDDDACHGKDSERISLITGFQDELEIQSKWLIRGLSELLWHLRNESDENDDDAKPNASRRSAPEIES